VAYLFEERRGACSGRPEEEDTPIYRLKLTPGEIEAIVSRAGEILRSKAGGRPAPPQPGTRLVTAAEVAEWCGVERSWVYAHAEQLGARKIGTGERPRLRFDLEEVSERIAALNGPQPGCGSRSTANAADPRKRSLSRRRRGIVVGQGQDGRAAHPRPRPGAEGDASTR
jgi:hypothetical protein